MTLVSNESVAAKPGDASRRPALEARRVVGLDGLRGIAVLSVILFHWFNLLGHTNPLIHAGIAATRAGWVGVDLFFALSGFLITGILADAKGSSFGKYLATFYSRRCLRIFPLYYGVIAALLFSGLLIPALATSGYHKFVADQGWFWPYGVNIGIGVGGAARFEYDWFELTHFWTLAVEEHFYLLWPFVIWVLRRRQAMTFAFAIMVCSLLLRIWAPSAGSGWLRGIIATPMSSGSLAAGALVALWLRSGVAEATARRVFACSAFAGLMGAITVGLIAHGFASGQYPVQTAGIAFLGILFAGLVGYVAVGPDPFTRRCLESRPLVTLGKYSYALYVFHNLFAPASRRLDFAHWFKSYSAGALAYLAIMTLITATLATASWHLYEKHFLRLKNKLPYAPRRMPPAP